MSDDERISALFRDAASDAPPAGFDHSAVVAGSRKATAQRRSAVLGAAVASVVVIVGVGLGIGMQRSGLETATDSAAGAPVAASEQAQRAEAVPDEALSSVPRADASQADAPPGAVPPSAAPLGPGSTECADRQDPALRALVDAALPEVAGAPSGATTMECRPGGERGVNVEVTEDGVTGLLTVSYLPPGVAVSVAQGGVTALRDTASGGTVLVSVRGEQSGQVPFADRVEDLATTLAPQL